MSEANRSRRTLRWLAERPHGATLREITDAIDPDVSTTIVGGMLGNLIKRGKVNRSGRRMSFLYTLAPGGLEDGRRVPLRERARRAAERRSAKPSAETPAEASTRAPVPVSAMRTAQLLAAYTLHELSLFAWLRAQPTARTFPELLDGLTPRVSAKALRSALNRLVSKGDVVRVDEDQPARYATRRATKAVRPKRAAGPEPANRTSEARRDALTKEAPAPAKYAKAKTAALAPTPRQTLDSTIARLPSKNVPGELDSDRLAADVAAFLAAGGAIEHVPIGKATKSQLRFEHDNSPLARARAAIAHRLA